MLRCRAKEEWICNTGGVVPAPPRPTTANQTKQTLTCCGQLEGWKGRGREDSSVEQETGDCIHKDRDRMGGP